MFGVELSEVLIFLRTIGIIVAGAAAFWGCFFLLLSGREGDKRKSALWRGVSYKLFWLLLAGLIFYSSLWVVLAIKLCVFCAYAHGGISIEQEISDTSFSLQKQYPLILVLVGGVLASMLIFFLRRHFLFKNIFWMYGFFFTAVSFLFIYPWAGAESVKQVLSTGLHNWHSIFTLGTVFVIDFLYIFLRYNLRSLLPKMFLLTSAVIWIGLGLGFISSGIVLFGEEFHLSSRTLFMQTIVGVIIINGVFISGPISRSIISFQRRMQDPSPHGKGYENVISLKLHRLVGVLGSISLVSWMSITALGGFRSLTLSYWQLWAFYIALILTIYIGREILDKLIERYKRPFAEKVIEV